MMECSICETNCDCLEDICWNCMAMVCDECQDHGRCPICNQLTESGAMSKMGEAADVSRDDQAGAPEVTCGG